MKQSKYKTANFSILPQDRVSGSSQEAKEMKFDLYLKTREVKQLNSYLERVMLFNRKKRQKWVGEHEDLINQLLDSFMEDSLLVMDGMELDSEAMGMSVELMANIRNAISSLRNLVYAKERVAN